MKNPPTLFNDTLNIANKIVQSLNLHREHTPIVIRDIYGRISLAIPAKRDEYKSKLSAFIEKMSALGAYVDKEYGIYFEDDFFDPQSVFQDATIMDLYIDEATPPLRILDRQVVGQDWLKPSSTSFKHPRITFHGIKGGVGRSTALSLLAYTLAQSGKNILLFDLDLESPGLSGLLLPNNRLPEYGIIDWLVEDVVGQGDFIITKMISNSPLSDNTTGNIVVVPALGANETSYIDKLSRIYADAPHGDKNESFSDRVTRLINSLEERINPDVVLIDSRAGLHDISAMSIVGLSTHAMLFAADTPQTWQGYRLLFSHWQTYPRVAENVRNKISMVQALFPEANQRDKAEKFLENSYTLFADTLYDQISPGDSNDFEAFNFDISEISAPHFPFRIKWNARFQEFDPLLIEQGIFTNADIEASFGDFLNGVTRLIEG